MKKLIVALTAGLMLGGIGSTGFSAAGQAATSWKTVSTKSYRHVAYYVKTTKNEYMWDLKHTKKIHNLKHYPRTTWYVYKQVKLQHGKKSGYYYELTDNKDKIKGLVYRSYLTKGDNPDDAFAHSAVVKSYGGGLAGIKSVRESAKLQADILALFPGTILNNSYSNDARNDLNAGVSKTAKYSKLNKNSTAIGIFTPYNWTSTSSKTNYTKLAAAVLNAQGYTASKRAKYKGYQIGIYATPHGSTSAYHAWPSGYGSFGIYLVPTGDSKLF
ncbi:D-alanyl-D-alanine carboxypeptidase [Secundilactobacillus pentosiphilus]|uniref:D-alanyl-D-alanine carboxypeptidase n=1 Tax=Secundilactobacillus pentosiphilus TaxID=1714682 RepID=A0A1Z5IP11_9LACO|nr:hypothetical protein [Secundilactobacillus pentosiphilus]GAX03483.1 D-alanyl-D-alanine carboxypeptidase [Secundilactobacillus pentosiphilus]